MKSRIHILLIALLLECLAPTAKADSKSPVRIGISAEFSMKGSQSAQAVEKGIRVAMDEINAAGGVLNGRPLALEIRDDRGVPARAQDNFRELATIDDLVAVFAGRLSPVMIEVAPIANQIGLPFLGVWAAADDITKHPDPNFVFRLSITDTWAVDAMLDHARTRRLQRLALFVPNTSWGRSNEAAAAQYQSRYPELRIEHIWYNWGDVNFEERVRQAVQSGVNAFIMVANEPEGALIVKQVAALPAASRVPIVSHWGILGGDFRAATDGMLDQVDLVVVHTYGFATAQGKKAEKVIAATRRMFGDDAAKMSGQHAFAQAYDLTHLLALAVKRAGSTDRKAVRTALEQIERYDGLLRQYRKPFAPGRHEALDRRQAVMARIDPEGRLLPLKAK